MLVNSATQMKSLISLSLIRTDQFFVICNLKLNVYIFASHPDFCTLCYSGDAVM